MARYLNGATIMTTPTPQSLTLALAASFDGIEARAERLLDDPEELRATAATANPGDVWSLNGVRISLLADGSLDHAQLVADLAPRLDACRAIGAGTLLAVPPRAPGLTEEMVRDGVRDGLAVAAERAAVLGIRVAFEFLGFFDCPIRMPAAAGRIVEGLEGVDLVLDACHWHASGAGPLDDFPVERLAMVHLNDAPAKTPSRLQDGDPP